MIFDFPNGDDGEWDLNDDGPRHLLLACDTSFASCHGGVIDIVTARKIDRQLLVQLDRALTIVVKSLLLGMQFRAECAKKHSDLIRLCKDVSATASIDLDDLDLVQRDAEEEKEAFLTYIAGIVSRSPTYLGETNGEDDCGPGGSSAYAVHWDGKPETAATHFNDRVRLDGKLLADHECLMKGERSFAGLEGLRECDLDFVTSVSRAEAESLASLGCRRIDLSRLRKLTGVVASALSEFQGDLALRGVSSLSDAAARGLSKHEGDLELNGLTTITVASARALSKHEGSLDLSGLTDISDAAAEALSKHRYFLNLSGLQSLSTGAAAALASHQGAVRLGPSISSGA